MTGSVFARCATVLRGRGNVAPLVASVVGRLALGMTGLAVAHLVYGPARRSAPT